jgi:hypothetical protein
MGQLQMSQLGTPSQSNNCVSKLPVLHCRTYSAPPAVFANVLVSIVKDPVYPRFPSRRHMCVARDTAQDNLCMEGVRLRCLAYMRVPESLEAAQSDAFVSVKEVLQSVLKRVLYCTA